MMFQMFACIICLVLFVNPCQAAQDIISQEKDTPLDVAIVNEEVRKLYVEIDSSGYEDRGEATAWDYQAGDLTTDWTWNDLDLSSIVPDGAKAVLIRILIGDDAVGSRIQFRKDGSSNVFNIAGIWTQINDGTIIGSTLTVGCSTDRIVEYRGSNLAFATISICIMGWWR